MSSCSEDMVEGERFEGGKVVRLETLMLKTSKRDRRRCPQVLQRRNRGESLQDEDERGRMIVGQQDSMSFTSAGTRKGSWIPGDYCQRGGECLSRPWRVEVSAVAFSSLRHPVLTPFTRWDSLATLCHRRCRETLSRSLGPCACLGAVA